MVAQSAKNRPIWSHWPQPPKVIQSLPLFTTDFNALSVTQWDIKIHLFMLFLTNTSHVPSNWFQTKVCLLLPNGGWHYVSLFIISFLKLYLAATCCGILRKNASKVWNRNLTSVWPDDQIVLSIFGHFQQWKCAQYQINCAKVSGKLCPKPNKP